MKIFSILCVIGLFIFLLTTTGNATHTSRMPKVLIIKENPKKDTDYIEQEAYTTIMRKFKNEGKHNDIHFVSKAIYFDDIDDINEGNRTNKNKCDFITSNKENLVYTVFLSGDTSKYKKIKDCLPEEIPIITSIGTTDVLDRNNTWVTTISSLAKGKANAIEKLIEIEKKDGLIVLFDKAEGIDTYTDKVVAELNIPTTKISYIREEKIENQKKLQEGLDKSNKLILLVSKSRNKTMDIFENFEANISSKIDQKNDILLLKINKEDKKDINLTKSKIFELSYTIPGYNPDMRLPLYQKAYDICDNYKKVDKDICLKIYGDAYIKLHTYLNLALSAPNTNSDSTMSDESNASNSKNKDVNITAMRKSIHKNIINHDKTNTYYHKESNKLYKFKKSESGKCHYNSLIDLGITNYYIVRLDNENDGFLHYKQISNDNKDGNVSTVYLDMKLSNLIVHNLSASSTYIEGFIRVLTSNKEFDLNTSYKVNFIDTASKKSEIIFVKENNVTVDGMKMHEKFYTFSGNFNINNDLLFFPADRQKIYISFTPTYTKDTNDTTNSYLMHLQEQDKTEISFDKWTIEKIKPFLSKKIMVFRDSAIEENSSISYKPVSNFEITIKRQAPFGFIGKFILPLVIIILLVIGTRLHLNHDLSLSNSIYGSSFAGIISIYFIFNLVIGIENFIYFDAVFLVVLAFPVVLMIRNIYKHRLKK